MKTIKFNIIRFALLGAASVLLLSCNKFLDVLPDNRTEIDTPTKVANILLSAYPDYLPYGIWELMSDNVTDAGTNFGLPYNWAVTTYHFEDNPMTNYDNPFSTWQNCYSSIASANVALRAIEELGDTAELAPYKGEALLCRAFAHFILVNTFCQAYYPGSEDLGIPYVDIIEETVYSDIPRGTVTDVYEKMIADIEAGFPLIDDSVYAHPVYHFTRRAAAAFASQVYLFYGDYEKSIEYGDVVLGDNPTKYFRNWTLYKGEGYEKVDAFVSSSETANIFNIGFHSWFTRYRQGRYSLANELLPETLHSKGPWGSSLGVINSTNISGPAPGYYFLKIREVFLADPVTQVGHPYSTRVVFSTEMALLNRAEAKVLAKDYDGAASDLSFFYKSAGANVTRDKNYISEFYKEGGEGKLFRKVLAPKNFTFEEEMQENMVHACLHARRVFTAEYGERLLDLKRYGIAYTHVLEDVEGDSDDIKIEPYDFRLAVQIPDMVRKAGMPGNPR